MPNLGSSGNFGIVERSRLSTAADTTDDTLKPLTVVRHASMSSQCAGLDSPAIGGIRVQRALGPFTREPLDANHAKGANPTERIQGRHRASGWAIEVSGFSAVSVASA